MLGARFGQQDDAIAHVLALDQRACDTVDDQVGRHADARRDDRHAARHALHQRHRAAFLARGDEVDVERAIAARQLGADLGLVAVQQEANPLPAMGADVAADAGDDDGWPVIAAHGVKRDRNWGWQMDLLWPRRLVARRLAGCAGR